MRRAVLQSFPPAVDLVVVAPVACEFSELAALRGDPATRVVELNEPFEGADNVILEGLDAVADPAGLLHKVASSAPSARLFALVANAAHFGTLGAFYRGTPPASEHPLVETELEPLLRSGGWRLLEIRRIYDDTIPDGPLPVRLNIPPLTFTVDDGEMLARGRVQAFVAIADPV